MIPNLYIRNGWKSPFPSILNERLALGFQVNESRFRTLFFDLRDVKKKMLGHDFKAKVFLRTEVMTYFHEILIPQEILEVPKARFFRLQRVIISLHITAMVLMTTFHLTHAPYN